MQIIGRDDPGVRMWQFRVDDDLQSGSIRFLRFDVGVVVVANFTGTKKVNDGVWHHVAATFSIGDGSKIYIDGLLDGIDADTTAMNNVGSVIHIGRKFGSSSDFFTGLIDLPIIYNRALSASEIALLFAEPFIMFKDPNEVAILGAVSAVGSISASPSASISSSPSASPSVSSSPSASISSSPSASPSISSSPSASVSSSPSASPSISASASSTPSASVSASPSVSASASSTPSSSPSASVSASPSVSSSVSATPSTSLSASVSATVSASISASVSASPSSIATTNIHIFSDNNDIEPVFVADLSKNVLTKGEIEVQGESYLGGKSRRTLIGGLAVLLTNKTGSATVAGQLVLSSTGTDDAFATVGANSEETIGIVLDSGIADGSEAWMVESGIADVLIDAGGCTHGDRMIASATAGSADVWNVGGAVATHFREIGHCLETRVGAGLARVKLHFN